MSAAVKQIIETAKKSLEKATGAQIISIQYKAIYSTEKIERLKDAVCKAYGIEMRHLVTRSRQQELVKPRQMFHYIAIEKLGMKVVDAGKVFNTDHTTAMHGRTKVKDLLSIMDEETHEKLELINEYLNE